MVLQNSMSITPDFSDHCLVRIAGIDLQLSFCRPVEITHPYWPFLKTEMEKTCWCAEFLEAEHLPDPQGSLLFRGKEYAVYLAPGGTEEKIFFDQMDYGKAYAVSSRDDALRRVVVRYLPQKQSFVSQLGNGMFHIGWERILIGEDRVVLHAACIETEYGGILFSGPSGIGKSTQAELWRKHADASLLNGDRTILYRGPENWMGCGSPYAGSSRCYRDAQVPVRAIVMLSQAESCSIRRMAPREAFVRLYAGTTVNDWDSEFVNRISDMLMSLISEIPVYALACTPDENAVRILKKELAGGGTT